LELLDGHGTSGVAVAASAWRSAPGRGTGGGVVGPSQGCVVSGSVTVSREGLTPAYMEFRPLGGGEFLYAGPRGRAAVTQVPAAVASPAVLRR